MTARGTKTRECPVRGWARWRPDALALEAPGGVTLSYAALDDSVSRVASALARLGLSPGDRLALVSFNRVEVVLLLHAAARLGATLTPLNARLSDVELGDLLEQVGARRVLVSEERASGLPGATSLEELSQAARAAPSALGAEVSGEHPRLMLFTSGTSGRPKGALLGDESLLASALASGERLGSESTQRWLCCLPLFHIGGLAMALRVAEYGASLRLHTAFDPGDAAAALLSGEVTHASFVPQMLGRVLTALGGAAVPERFRAALIGGAPAGQALLAAARKRGLRALRTYGLTEACSQVATEVPEVADGATCGPPLKGVRVDVRGPRGESLGPGEEGELWISGATLMRGYWGGASVPSDGWFRTGDHGYRDEAGRLVILARREDLILSGGENIYPAELEEVLRAHPGVLDACVVAVEDEAWGQVPWAFVEGVEGLSEREVAAHLATRVASFRRPRRVVVLAALPRTGSGKVDRAAVKAIAPGQGAQSAGRTPG